MAEFCPRSIHFKLLAKQGIVVDVTAVENAGNIDFTVEVLGSPSKTADLRGLFFHLNESDIPGLKIIDSDGVITDEQIKANGVSNLGGGVNMNGAAGPFDVGIAFGTPGKGHDLITGPVHFTLDAAQDITLDDIAHLQFGARLTSVGDKITAFAPAAPDAIDDTGTTHEDTPVQLFVLANDTDADGTASLKITEIHQEPGAHGTVTIAADGKSLFYTPNHDFAGLNTDPNSIDDSFTYCITDANGGEDHATVNMHIIPVADQPTISFEVLAPQDGDPVNEIRLHVTATTADIDGSELLSSLVFADLPAGVTMSAGAITHSLVDGVRDSASEDVVLFLPTDHSSNFDFSVTATADENGNGDPDTASVMASKHIQLDVAHNATQETFTATNQSIWDPSLPGGIDDSRFLGIDVSGDPGVDLEPLGSAGGHYELKVGFQSTLHATLGDIDATLPYDITIDTAYNRTTDSLLITPNDALASGGFFNTTGPGGSYNLDFIFHALLSAHADIAGIGGSATVGPLDLGFNIFGIDSATFSDTIDIPPLNPVATLTLQWPQVDTVGSQNGVNSLHSDGASPDIVNLNVDMVALALAALGISPNPLDLGFVNLLSLSVNGGVNMTQHFDLTSLGLDASLKLEDNTMIPVTFGTPLDVIQNASTHDTNHDGLIGMDLLLTPHVDLTNHTGIGFNVGASLDLLKFPDPVGTLVSLGGDFPLGEIPIYTNTFGLDFDSQNYLLSA
ncbi:cadherin-like domain-containing protein [Bradyrhizobium tropiciagri]|uniref:Ig-like domain-containing protein n=1 Tax=Bradyrhizobium tropiciagri TaxID=312253 RepID=UPI001BAC31F4|nr:Ig-like domain-containing protein [Bradyrhizobium tropiciagri]MBR0868819.1 cadherin-like domain-containing protein [Bradyrhizobium tropiciagri]